MAKYEITSPDGRKFEVTAPDDASQDDVLAYAQGQFNSPAPATSNQKEYSWVNFAKDSGVGVMEGVLGVAKLGALAGDQLQRVTPGASDPQGFNNPAYKFFDEYGESVNAQKSDYLRRIEQSQQRKVEQAGDLAKKEYGDGWVGKVARFGTEAWEGAKGLATNPALMGNFVAEQIPMLGTMKVGAAGAEKLVGAAANIAPKAMATKAGQAVVSNAGTAGAVGAGMGLQGADIGGDAFNQLMGLPDQTWRNHPDFDGLAREMGPQQAKITIANREAAVAGGKAALATLLTTLLPGGASMEKALAGKGIAKAKAIPGAIYGEGRQEGLEEGFGKLYGNLAVASADPSIDVWKGVGGATGQGAVGGGILGGGMTAARVALDAMAGANSDQPATQPPGPPSLPTAADVLGTPEQGQGQSAPPLTPQPTASDVLGTPEATGNDSFTVQPTEAEKALYTPKSLTALDRANELEAKMNEVHSAAASGDQDAANQWNALRAERDSITASWPKATPGVETSFTTEAGARLNGQYALIEAGDLTTSHDESLRPVQSYPAELQPRERERHASEMQIQQIVGRLDPARLGESADVATGAPIVGADGLVESGNARTIALKRVYQANGQKAIDYKQYLKDNADRFGITPESVDAMQKPVLVRVRKTPVNRAEFARQANQATVARMSPSEQARSDAAQIDSLDDLNPTETGEFSSGSSASFIRRFMAKLPATEQSGLVDSGGQLSQAGYQRIRNAVLAKAYGDSPVLQRMVESLDGNIRNVGTALLRVAPHVAKTREAINEGALHDADLTPDLMAAVEELSMLKDKGTSVTEALAQAGMFGDKLTPESRELLAFMDANIRSSKRIAEFIQSYLEALQAAGNPVQGSMLGDTVAPAKRDLIAAARRIANGDTATDSPAAGDTAAPQESGQQSANPQGNQAGARGNETSDQQLVDQLNTLNPQLKTKLTVTWVDESDPRVAQLERTEGGTAVGGHNGSSIILVRGRADRQTLLHEIRHMIDMLLGGYELRKWLKSDAELMKRVVSYLKGERAAGRLDSGSRMTDVEETTQSLLDAYYRNKEGLRSEFPDIVQFLEQMGADKYASIMQEVGAGKTAPEFIKAPGGSIDFGEIPSLSSKLTDGKEYPSEPIRMEVGGDFGKAHIQPERLAEFQENGYATEAEMLDDVAKHYTHIYEQPNGRLLLVKRNGRAKFSVVELQPHGDYYGATTLFLEDQNPKGKPYEERGGRVLLWPVAGAASSGSDATFPATTINAGAEAADADESNPNIADQQAEGKIEDFGEKLGGARKDQAAALRDAVTRELSDDEIASQPLSKIWPKESIDQIEDPFIAAVAHAARAEVPAKPRQPYKLKGWVNIVKTMRGLTGYMLRGSVSKEMFAAKLREGSRGLEHFAAKVSMLESIGRENWDRVGRVEEYPQAYKYGDDGKTQIPSPIVRVEIDGISQRYEASSVADVLDKVRDALGEAPKEKRMEFEVRGTPGRYAINKNGDKLYRKLKTFETSKEALAYPYLLEGEIQPVAEAFDSLFATIKTRQTDSGVAMFSRKNSHADLPSVDQSVIDGLIDGMPGARQAAGDARIVTVFTPSELPSEVLKEAERQGIPQAGIHGVLYKGFAYIVRQNLKSRQDVEEVLAHEILGHGGVHALMGDAREAVLLESFNRAGGVGGIRMALERIDAKIKTANANRAYYGKDRLTISSMKWMWRLRRSSVAPTALQ